MDKFPLQSHTMEDNEKVIIIFLADKIKYFHLEINELLAVYRQLQTINYPSVPSTIHLFVALFSLDAT